MNLLIINDEEITAETMKREISWSDYGIDEVKTAYSASSARKIINEDTVDLMLCDIEMPDEDGIQLLRWVRENDKKIECIFLTCHASFDYAKAAIELDCQDYLLVPAKYETIGNKVKGVVERILKDREDLKYQEFGKKAIQEKMEHAVEVHGEKLNPKQLVENAVGYIMKNLSSQSLSVQEIADSLYLHPYYLNRIFKKYTDSSISQYIISERMKMAATLLSDGHLSANSVSEEVGYKSYSNFNLTFKKYYGCTPSKYADKDDR